MRAALVIVIVMQIALTTAAVLLRTPPTVTHAQTTVPISLSVPVTIQAHPAPPPPAPPPASSARPSCPPPRSDAPRAAAMHPPQDASHVVASRTNAGWIAAWDTDHVFVSTDAGATFARVLDGPGGVDAVTFDCFGNVAVLRDGTLGIREGTREHWQAIPGVRGDAGDPAALIGGGPDVVVVGTAPGDTWTARLAVTPDRGATWWYRDLVDYWESATLDGYQASDGSLHIALTTADCMSDPVYWLRIRDGKVETDELGSVGAVALVDDIALVGGPDGARWKRFGEPQWRDVTGIVGAASVVPGPLPRITDTSSLYRVSRGRATRLGAWNARSAEPVTDRAGRTWAVRETIDGEAAWVVVVD